MFQQIDSSFMENDRIIAPISICKFKGLGHSSMTLGNSFGVEIAPVNYAMALDKKMELSQFSETMRLNLW
ncbi:hypothetical protein V6N13_008129 [Hibiscus sabdariffa]